MGAGLGEVEEVVVGEHNGSQVGAVQVDRMEKQN